MNIFKKRWLINNEVWSMWDFILTGIFIVLVIIILL
jgi:hypothetical protein